MDDEDKSVDSLMKMMTNITESQSFSKVDMFVRDLISTEQFKKDIQKIRKKFNIPKEGFDDLITEQEIVNNKFFIKELKKILTKNHLHKRHYLSFIEDFTLYGWNYREDFTLGFDFNRGLIFANDTSSETDEYNFLLYEKFPEKEVNKIYSQSYLKEDNEHFPVSLRIHPHASKRDILDFVDKNYTSLIEPTLNHYKKDTKISKFRKKNSGVNERNEFIYENRKLPSKELMALVQEKYGKLLDYTYINQIISKKRKEKK